MSLTLSFVYIAGGLAMLFIGADWLVRGSSALALRFGVAPLVVGLTVVAFGTSSPELVVSIEAALTGRGDIALGNVIGSNIANLALILGLSAVIRPMKVHAQLIRLDAPLVVGASFLLAGLLFDRVLARWEGVLLTIGFVAYVVFTVRTARQEEPEVQEEFEGVVEPPRRSLVWDVVFIVTGLALLGFGANFLVNGATAVAEYFDVSQAIIGLTIVAIGTSLPELATSMVAALRGEGDIAIGNLIGSNIFNILGILGIASTVAALRATGIGMIDLGAMLLIAVLMLPMMRSGYRLGRIEGGVLLACYAGYMWLLL